MYAGDEDYGDEITSPLYRPMPNTGLPNPLARIQASDDCECLTCDGRGGKLEYDSDGDGAWAQTTTNLDLCPDCLGDNKCPGCGMKHSVIDLNTFVCDACGWIYDESRFDYDPSDDYDWEDFQR